MSEDEVFSLMASLVVTWLAWHKWVIPCFTVRDFDRANLLRVTGLVAPGLAFAFLLWVLRTQASHDVQSDGLYIFFYLTMGMAWLGGVMHLAGVGGLSFRDDWLERRNPSAAAAGTGLLLGGIAAFAGGNIGDGPGWWVVIFCATLSTGALFAAWSAYTRLSDAMERVTIGRDLAAGLRLGGFLLLAGVIAGRAVAGDWHSTGETLADFGKLAWPLLPYTLGAGLVEGAWGKSTPRPLSVSLACVTVHLGVAGLYLYWAGPWN